MSNKKVYILDNNPAHINKIQTRLNIENNFSLVGANTDAATGYTEIREVVPDILIFGYPSNFTAEQLNMAMKNVNQNMTFVAILCNDNFAADLQNNGITHIIKESNIDSVVNILQELNVSDPFDPFNVNSMLNKQNNNAANPFATSSSSSINTNLNTNSGTPFSGATFGGQNNNPLAKNLNINKEEEANGIRDKLNIETQSPQFSPIDLRQNDNGKLILKRRSVALHCPKGGVGKTTLSLNIAALLANATLDKQGMSKLKVLLVDMDWAFGDICTNLCAQASPNVMNWVEDIESRKKLALNSIQSNVNYDFTQAQIDKYLIHYKDTGLYILAAPALHNDYVNIQNPGETARIIIDNIKKNCDFDIVIYDCGNNLEDYTVQALMSADLVYEITTLDMSTMADITSLTSTFRSIQFPMDRLRLIFNKCPASGADVDLSTIEATMKLNIIATVPENPNVRTSNNNGVPLVLGKTAPDFKAAIEKIVNNMVGIPLFGRKRRKVKESKSGFFSRLFK